MADTLKSVNKSSTKDSKEVRVEVREIKNGYIIRKSTEWTDAKKGWQHKSEEWYSETDPFEVTDKSLAEIFD